MSFDCHFRFSDSISNTFSFLLYFAFFLFSWAFSLWDLRCMAKTNKQHNKTELSLNSQRHISNTPTNWESTRRIFSFILHNDASFTLFLFCFLHWILLYVGESVTLAVVHISPRSLFFLSWNVIQNWILKYKIVSFWAQFKHHSRWARQGGRIEEQVWNWK